MSAYVDKRIVHDGNETTIFPVNRWAQGANYSIQVKSGTWTVTASSEDVNKLDEGSVIAYGGLVATRASDGAGVSLTGITANIYCLVGCPLQTFSFESTGGGAAEIVILQQGSSGG